MGHYIQCIIGKEQIINELVNNWIHAIKIDLNEGFNVITTILLFSIGYNYNN
jgi:hypothetical protein